MISKKALELATQVVAEAASEIFASGDDPATAAGDYIVVIAKIIDRELDDD